MTVQWTPVRWRKQYTEWQYRICLLFVVNLTRQRLHQTNHCIFRGTVIIQIGCSNHETATTVPQFRSSMAGTNSRIVQKWDMVFTSITRLIAVSELSKRDLPVTMPATNQWHYLRVPLFTRTSISPTSFFTLAATSLFTHSNQACRLDVVEAAEIHNIIINFSISVCDPIHSLLLIQLLQFFVCIF